MKTKRMIGSPSIVPPLAHHRAFHFRCALMGIIAAAGCGALYTAISGWLYVQAEHATLTPIAQAMAVGMSSIYGLLVGAIVGVPVATTTTVVRAATVIIMDKRNRAGQFTGSWILSCLLFLGLAGYCWSLPEWGSHHVTIVQSGSFLGSCILTAGIATQLFTVIRIQRIERQVTLHPIHLD